MMPNVVKYQMLREGGVGSGLTADAECAGEPPPPPPPRRARGLPRGARAARSALRAAGGEGAAAAKNELITS
jgi:hypothetical protein